MSELEIVKTDNTKELKQEKLDSFSNPGDRHLSEEEIRALLKAELANYRGVIRVNSGYMQSGDNKMKPSGWLIGGILPGSEPSLLGWANTLTFSAVDADTVEWTSGVITLSDGTTYNIVSGNTGDMSTLTYIYLDINTSETILQTTTTQADSVGAGKILVAVAKNNTDITSDAPFTVFGGSIDSLFTADNIASNTITANQIAANTITAAEMNVSQLSAISADIGTITAGTVTGVDIRAVGGGSGIDVRMNSSTGRLEFYEGGDLIGYMAGVASTQDIVFDADNNIILQCDGMIIEYNVDNTGEDLFFKSNGSTKWIMDSSGDFKPNTDNDVELGSSSVQILKGWFEDIDVDDLVVNTGCTGCAYQEMNLLQPQEKHDFLEDRKKPKEERIKDKKEGKKFNPTGFEEGDVLAWKGGKLVKAKIDTCKCVVAVSSKHGMPIVLGAEKIKVIGEGKEGDFLVSTETEGYARAWVGDKEPPKGTVIAKAMEYWNKKGLIMAMINNF